MLGGETPRISDMNTRRKARVLCRRMPLVVLLGGLDFLPAGGRVAHNSCVSCYTLVELC